MVLRCGFRALSSLRFADAIKHGGGPEGRVGLQLLLRTTSSTTSLRFSSTADDSKKDVTTTAASSATGQAASAPEGKFGRMTHHRVNKLEKFFLVWGGKYKSLAEVPDMVSQDTLERARNKARIKINLMMAAATLFGCLLMVMSGKKALKEGVTVTKINEEWHKQYEKEAKLKEMQPRDTELQETAK